MWQIAQDPVSEFGKVQFAESTARCSPLRLEFSLLDVVPLFVDNAYRDCTVLRGTGQGELCRVGNRF